MNSEFFTERLHEINRNLMFTEGLNEKELTFLYKCLRHDEQKIVHGAAILLTALDKHTVQPILNNFGSYTQQQQKSILPLLMDCTFMEPYKFALDFLKTVDDDNDALFIVICLANTDYFIFPLILVRLDTDDLKYKSNLKDLLKRIGYDVLEKYLVLLPQLVYEDDFRDIFGSDKINALKKVIGDSN
jgi:hypothetical protein